MFSPSMRNRPAARRFRARFPLVLLSLLATAAAATVMTRAFVAFLPAGSPSAAVRAPRVRANNVQPAVADENLKNLWMKLQDGKTVRPSLDEAGPAGAALRSGKSKPVSVATADLDMDGYPDLVTGYSGEGPAFVTLQRGNPQAYAPTDPNVLADLNRSVFANPFLAEAKTVELPEAPDFLLAGDFTHDGVPDVIAAARGANALYLIETLSEGVLAPPTRISLPGTTTALAAGSLNGADARPDLAVGVETRSGHELLVFDRLAGLAVETPSSYAMPGEVTSIAFGRLDDDPFGDVAVAAGGQMSVLHGRWQTPGEGGLTAPPCDASRIDAGFAVQSLSVGEFMWDRDGRAEIAALAMDGSVRVLARGEIDQRPYAPGEAYAGRERGRPAHPESALPGRGAANWSTAETVGITTVAAPARGAYAPKLIAAKMGSQAADDILVMDPSDRMVHVLFSATPDVSAGPSTMNTPRVDMEFPVESAPLAVLPMRLNVDGRQSLVIVTEDGEVLARPQAPAATFMVTKTTDTNDGVCDADCSLREAVAAANAAAGADTITFSSATNGTPIQLTRVGDDNTNVNGDLDVTGPLTVGGNGSATTIIQAGASTAAGIDKIFSVNPLFTTPFASSFSGMTIRFGNNPSGFATNGFGGALDWEGSGTGTISVATVFIDQCRTTDGDGGGLALTNSSAGGGSATLAGVMLNGNSANRTLAANSAFGGGVFVGTTTTVFSNLLVVQNNSGSGPNSQGEGFFLFGPSGSAGVSTLNNSVVQTHSAASDGGGVYSAQPLSMTNGFFLGNTSGRFGGALWLNHTSATSTVTESTFINNSATTAGGAIRLDSATMSVLNMSYCRIVSNTAPTGSGLSVLNGTANVDLNWWQCNGGPSASPCNTAILSGAGALDFTPWIVLRHTASPSTILLGQTTTLTATFTFDSAGGAISPSNLDEFIGIASSFNTPVKGTLSMAQTSIQSNGSATAVFTATTTPDPTCALGSATATVDAFGVVAPITINEIPTIVCPANITTNTALGTCAATVTFTPTTTGCPTPTLTCTPASGSSFPRGTTTVNCSVMNVEGSAMCSFTVTVVDNEAPSVTCPANISTNTAAGQCNATVTYTTPTATDNCPGVGTVTCAPASGTMFAVGTTTVTCSVMDASSNPASCSFTVTVTDNQAPSVTCPANITTNTAAGQCSAVVTYTTPTATDNCPGATVNCVPASGATFNRGVTTVTCTATDASSNTTNCTFTVTVTDNQAPTVTCPANISMNTAAGQCNATVNYTTPTATDNCPGATVNCVPASGTMFTVGTTTVTCTATDASSNTTQCSFTVTVTDNQAPTVTCPANISMNTAAGQCSAVVTYTTPTASDNCPGPTVNCAPASGTTFNRGVTTVTCTATDANSNTSTCTFTVTVNDAQNPTITCPANITTNTAAGQCSAVVSYTTTATDNCPGVTVACMPASGATFARGVTTVSCTATDTSSNTASCSFTVTVNDNQAPVVTCPANIMVVENPPSSGSATVSYTATVSDNCPSPVINCVPASGSSFPIGTTTVTCTGTDASSNTSMCSFTVTVQPACTITCPANVSVNNTAGQCGAIVTYAAPSTTGMCGTVTCLPASGSFFSVGVTTVTCTTTSGPMCSFTVTVVDAENPTVTCPANITANTAAGQCSAVVTFTATASDNCPGVSLTCVPASGSTFARGVTTVTCTATDTASNTAQCSFTVTVNDNQAPSITCPANVTVAKTAGQCSAVVNYTTPTASDNCPGATVACLPVSGAPFPVGTTTVTCTATDTSSNTTNCTFTVTVTDPTPPSITCPANITANTDSGQCSAVVTFANPVVTDNCPGTTVGCVPASGATFALGTTTVTCTATDTSSNTSTCTFTVTVVDAQAPSVTCPANITASTASGQCSAVVNYTATASDNCPSVSLVCVPASGSTFALGVTTVTCTATDSSSNQSTCSFTVTVVDNQAPSIMCPANITIMGTGTSGCSATQPVTYPNPTVTDNCPGAAFTCVPASGSTFNEGVTTVVCTATDVSGNTSTCSFTVSVGATYTFCAVDDGTGDRFQMDTNMASPTYRRWRYTFAATGATICGMANSLSYVPGIKLLAYDNDYSAENPDYYMNASFGTTTGTVTIRQPGGATVAFLRDRNLSNSTCP